MSVMYDTTVVNGCQPLSLSPSALTSSVTLPSSASIISPGVGRVVSSLPSAPLSSSTDRSLLRGNGLQPLGNTITDLPTPPSQEELGDFALTYTTSADFERDRRYKLWFLQKAAKKALRLFDDENLYHRLHACCVLMRKEHVALRHSNKTKRAYYSGLCVCGLVWPCPICAFKISTGRRVELRQAMEYWRSLGYYLFMLTFTLRHHLGDHLPALLTGIRNVHTRFKSGKSWTKIKKRYGIEAYAQALELTYGRNGWHPHIHGAAFCRAGDLESAIGKMRARWGRFVKKEGLAAVNDHGLKIDPITDPEQLAMYITKYGGKRDIAFEMTGGATKKARGKAGRTLAQLLSDFALYGDVQDALLWVEGVKALKQKNFFRWSRGSRKKLLIDLPEKSDMELATEELEKSNPTLAYISYDQWQLIRQKGLYHAFRVVGDACDRNLIAQFLLDHGIPLGTLTFDDEYWKRLDAADPRYYRPGNVPKSKKYRHHAREVYADHQENLYLADERAALSEM